MKQSTGRWLGDSNRTGSNDVSVKIPSKAVTSTCINLESTEKKVNVVLYQEPNKILSNSNNTITNSTLQEPPIEEKDKSEKVLKAEDDLWMKLDDFGWSEQRTKGVRHDTAN